MTAHSRSRVQVSVFDTMAIEPELRREAWHANMGVLFDLSDVSGETLDGDVASRIEVCTVGHTVFGVTRAQSQLFERSARRVARDGMDHILLQLFLQGGGRTEEGERLHARDMLVIDLDQPHRMLNTHFANLTLVLPRDLYPDLSLRIAALHGQRLGSERAAVRMVGDSLLSLWRNVDDLEVIEACHGLEGCLGLLQKCLAPEARLAEETHGHAAAELKRSMRRYIDAHLSETLTPTSLASRFGLSRSGIYRLFADEGGVARHVWQRRLQRSMRLLLQPQLQHLPILAVASECGFRSEAHFSRAFRAAFGMTPGQVRARASAVPVTEPSGRRGPRPGSYPRDLADWILGL